MGGDGQGIDGVLDALFGPAPPTPPAESALRGLETELGGSVGRQPRHRAQEVPEGAEPPSHSEAGRRRADSVPPPPSDPGPGRIRALKDPLPTAEPAAAPADEGPGRIRALKAPLPEPRPAPPPSRPTLAGAPRPPAPQTADAPSDSVTRPGRPIPAPLPHTPLADEPPARVSRRATSGPRDRRRPSLAQAAGVEARSSRPSRAPREPAGDPRPAAAEGAPTPRANRPRVGPDGRLIRDHHAAARPRRATRGFAPSDAARPNTATPLPPADAPALGDDLAAEFAAVDDLFAHLDSLELRSAPPAPAPSGPRAALGDTQRVAQLVTALDAIDWRRLDPRAGFLVTQADGRTSFEDLIIISGLPDHDACTLLLALVDQGVLA